jgi:hypothetical protein
MKITKRQLRRIIREEKAKLTEQFEAPSNFKQFKGSQMDLDDYRILEDAVVAPARNFIRDGYTKEDLIQALTTIIQDVR